LFRSSGVVESIGVSNPALGMLPASVYRETVAQLDPGNILLLFTDGATEVTGQGEVDLDKEGLIRLVGEQTGSRGPSALDLRQLQQQLLLFSNQIHLADDLTLIKLSRTK
jgi:serine phosphatase RsbU (regulator of sigma subunit)